MQRLLSLFFILFCLAGTAVARDTIIYLMRHGENVPTPADTRPYNPHLNEAGKARAQELARILHDAPITRIFSTNLHRTLETATPLAELKGLDIEIYDPENADSFVRELRSQPGVYVVMGHSNTTPDMVNRLGGEAGSPIDHSEHDRLYVLVYQDDADEPVTILLRYGEMSKH